MEINIVNTSSFLSEWRTALHVPDYMNIPPINDGHLFGAPRSPEVDKHRLMINAIQNLKRVPVANTNFVGIVVDLYYCYFRLESSRFFDFSPSYLLYLDRGRTFIYGLDNSIRPMWGCRKIMYNLAEDFIPAINYVDGRNKINSSSSLLTSGTSLVKSTEKFWISDPNAKHIVKY